jgi:hypothetical protein
VRPTWRDLVWAAWPPLAALAGQLLAFSATGVWSTAIALVFWTLAIAMTRSRRLRRTPPVTPGWSVPAEHRVVCGEVGVVLTAATMLVGLPFAAPSDAWMMAALYGPVVAVTSAIMLPRFVRAALLGQPVLGLAPEGLTVNGRRLRWDDLTGVELLAYAEPAVVIRVRSGRRTVLRERYVHANLVYLLDLIGYYLAHPERRAAIGTGEEADRVTAALREARQAAPVGTAPILLPS